MVHPGASYLARLRVDSPAKDFAHWSVSPTSRLAYGSLRPQAILLTGPFRLQVISTASRFDHKSFRPQVRFALKSCSPYIALEPATHLVIYTDRHDRRMKWLNVSPAQNVEGVKRS